MREHLWDILRHFIERGQESRKVDLKQSLELDSKPARMEFAKDVAAMANTRGGCGYLVIGVKDGKHRRGDEPSDYVVGFSPANPEIFEQRMQQALTTYCTPVPEVRYEAFHHPPTGRLIGIVVIERNFERPYRVGEDVFVRRGSHTVHVDADTFVRTDRCVLLNLGRPVTPAQSKQIADLLGAEVDEIIDVEGTELRDEEPHLPQVRAMIQRVGQTREEWQSLPLVLNIHPFAPDAAATLAWIHGLRGHFPSVVRMTRNASGDFDVVEVMDLQSVRNEIRSWAVQP